MTARGWASVVRTALVIGLLLASATGSAAAAAEPLVIRGGDHADPPTGPPPGSPAGPSVRSVPSTGDPGFDDAWCGTPRSTDDSAGQVTTAPRFKVVYAYPTDVPNRFAQLAGPIQSSVRTFAQQVMGNSGDRKTIRFDLGTSCGPRALDIATVALPGSTSAYTGLDPTQFETIRDAVTAAVGPVPGPANLLVFVDVPCSATTAGRGDRAADERPGSLNASNQPSDSSTPMVAQVLHCGAETYFNPPGTPGTFLPDAPLHEIGHNLGAVQDSAPHGSRLGHCWDRADVMCYDDGGPGIPAGAFSLPPQCPLTGRAEFDCGADDYFNPAPAAGSYLATHWNLATSVFMCAPSACYAPVATPAAVIDASATTVTIGGAVDLSAARSSSANGDITEYRWDTDPAAPGDEVVSPSPTTSLRLDRRGDRPIALTVRDVFGRHAAASMSVRVIGHPPTVGAETPGRIVVGRYLTLTGRASADTGQAIAAQGWDTSGDGVIDVADTRLRHLFRRPGPARLRFLALDDAGQESVVDRSFTVRPAPALRLKVNTRSRRKLRRAIHVTVSRPPDARVHVRVSVGRVRGGVFKSSVSVLKTALTRADVDKRFVVRLGARLRRALRGRGVSLRVRATVPHFEIPAATSTGRVLP